MTGTEYWDESEFNFFTTLEDADKLLYVYDLMIGEFAYEYEGTDEGTDIFEFELEEDTKEEFRTDVRMEFIRGNDSDKIVLTGEATFVLEKVANDLMMNGMVLTNKVVEFTKYEPWEVTLTFDLIGNSSPISLN
jgi:tricorn protease-like protein